MHYRLRTLLVWVALIPPLIAVVVVGLERPYFTTVHRLRRRIADPNPVQRSTQPTPQPRLVEANEEATSESP